MNRRLLALCLCLALLAGCAPVAVQPVETLRPLSTQSVPTPTPTPDLSGAPLPLRQEAPAPTLTGSYSAFAVELLRTARQEGKNTLLSPLSVLLALGMTANGAGGETLAQFEALFGMDLPSLNAFCADLSAQLGALGGSTEASLANSLWADEDLAMLESFQRACEENYGAQLFSADLQSAQTVRAVNSWCSEKTRGMIPQIVDFFDESAVLALVNAVYLKNAFSSPFATPYSDWTMDFTAADGTVTQPLGMSNGVRHEQYISANHGKGVVLPYDDGRLGLLLMLPEEGLSLSEYLAGWDADTLRHLLDLQTDTKVDLTMPKFKTEWSGMLKGVLSAMGLSDAFDMEQADFSPMGQTADGRPLYIGEVIHKTAFEINEKGTEAAAATAVHMYGATAVAPVEPPVILRLDRPFVYGIVDLEQGVPLFLGTLEQVS